MKRLILFALLTLLLAAGVLSSAGAADGDDFDYTTRSYEVSEKDLAEAAARDYPGWRISDVQRYWAGSWEDQLACWTEIQLFRVDAHMLCQKRLFVLVNPLKSGDPVPWEVEDWAPVTVTEEAERFLGDMDPKDLHMNKGGLEECAITDSILYGCAHELLNEGETWEELFAYPDCLAGIVKNAAGQYCIRISHWNGAVYDSTVSSRYLDMYLDVNPYESFNDELYVNTWYFTKHPDGSWRLDAIEGELNIISIYDDYIEDASYLGIYDSNALLHYGVPAFDTELTEVDFSALPIFIQDAVPLLDSSGYACVRKDGVPMLDGPGGETAAYCYARLAGRILERDQGFVKLQIGSAGRGMTGWFAEEDLAFGPETEEIRCGFPSHHHDDGDGDYLQKVLEGVDPAELENRICLVWLIGKLPDGRWLVQLDVDTVCTAPADAFRDVGPARDFSEDIQKSYEEYLEAKTEWEENAADDTEAEE